MDQKLILDGVDYANEEMKHLSDRFGSILSEEDLRIIRLEIIGAYRKGYETAENKYRPLR